MENTFNIINLSRKIKVSKLVEKIIPTLSSKNKKGSSGITGVVGGSLEYTGAPYYSGISSLKTGADLSHIFCHVEAAIPIKCYSPELIVHPGFDYNNNQTLLDKTSRWFKSMDSLVIGPGLGRDESITEILKYFFSVSLNIKNLTHIIDADGLWHLLNLEIEKIIENKCKLILTPNATEFERLYNTFFKEEKDSDTHFNIKIEKDEIIYFEKAYLLQENNYFTKEIKLAKKLNNKIILKKGEVDIITNGNVLLLVGNEGSQKRCGGIGDILNGIIATFNGMKKKQIQPNSELLEGELLEICALACYVCKKASHSAYIKKGYSLTAPDVIEELTVIAKDYNL
jgi:ATP-dependent NAD(P)H-hydrate dehydratase